MKLCRPATEILSQLTEFENLLAQFTRPDPSDFPACAEWASFQNHHRELKEELAAALEKEKEPALS